jgi:hypothetical protein
MTGKELSDALLKLDAAQLPAATEPRALAWQVLDHDRRGIRRWVWATALLWGISVVFIAGAFLAFAFLFPKQAAIIHQAGPEEGLEAIILLTAFLSKISAAMAVALLALVFASLATIFLVLTARRATLRQVNASLLEISEQMRKLTERTPT